MYNALTGLGGSGQVNQTVAANANVALLSATAATAATALFVVGPIFDRVCPRVCLLLGGWTYPLYSGSLLAPTVRVFDLGWIANCHSLATTNCAFAIDASFIWVAQGAMRTTYVPESQGARRRGILNHCQPWWRCGITPKLWK